MINMETARMIKKILISIIAVYIPLFGDTSGFSALSLGDFDTSLSNSTGIAYTDSLVLKNHNYAAWSSLSNTCFSVSASYYSHELKDTDGSSSFDRFIFEDMNFAIPFGNRNVFGIAYYPVAIADITNVTTSEETVPESFEETTLRTLETKKGSVSNGSFIYGKGFKDVLLSISPSFKFGNYEVTRRYKYTSYIEGSDVVDWEKYFESTETTQIFHFTIGGGILYKSPSGIGLGATFSFPITSYVNKISGFNSTTSYGTVIDNISEEEEEITDAEWPAEFGLGVSYKFQKFVFSYDFYLKQFDGIKTGIDDDILTLTDYSRNVFGISFDPRYKRYDPYYKRMVYSGYLSFEKRPYEAFSEPVYDITGTLGLNFPFNNEKTNIELKLGYTRSGNIDDNGLENNSIRLQLNFISSDRWKLKKERYND